jgi:hypothetical protein
MTEPKKAGEGAVQRPSARRLPAKRDIRLSLICALRMTYWSKIILLGTDGAGRSFLTWEDVFIINT